MVIEPSNVPRFLYVNLVLWFLLLISFFRKSDIFIPTVYFVGVLFAFYLLNITGILWALNKADAIYEAQKIFTALIVILSLFNCIQNEGEEKNLVKSFIVIGALYLAYTVHQISQLPDFKFETLYKIMAFAEHKNLLGSFLFMLFSFFLYGFLFMQGTWKQIGISSTVVTLPLLVFLQVRSVYVALLVTGSLFFIYAVLKFRVARKKIFLGLSITIGLFILIMVLNPTIAKRWNVSAYSTSGSGAERLKIWGKTIHLIEDHPLLGVGAGNWQYNYSRYGVNDIENITQYDISFQRPHNDLLWIISETGFLGFALILLIIVFIFKKSYPEIKKGNHKTVLFFSFLVGLLTESLFSFPKERVTHIVLASVMLVLLFKTLPLSVKVPPEISKRITVIFLLVLSLSLLVGAYRLKGEYYTTLLLDAKEKNDAAGVIKYGTKALSPFYLTDPTSTPIYTFLGWGYSARHQTDSLFYVSEGAYKIAPYDYEVLSNYGFALEKKGKREEAKKMLGEALRINTTYEPARINMFILEYNSKNYREAYKWLSLIPDYQIKYPKYYDKVTHKMAEATVKN